MCDIDNNHVDFAHAQYDVIHAIAMATSTTSSSTPFTDAGSELLLRSLPRAKSRLWFS